MNGAEVLITFKGNTKDVDKSVQKVDASVGSIAKGTVVATGITKAFSAAWGLVSKNMDSAIDRYDTLSNFSNVMKNLGISAEESQKAINKMADKLVGLPTTLQEGAMAVQRLTAKNSDIKKSTDLFLAMNNAILAGGAPLANQQAALEQLTQAYSKGKMDMMEWRTIQTAMPAQLKQIASAMGYSTEELGEMMRQGDQTQETMDKFTDTMMQLNEKGLEGFGNLEEQARSATGGVRTAITNMNSRIAQGITAMIEGVDKGLQDAKLGTLANVFENIGNTIRDVLKGLAPFIVNVIKLLANFANWVNKNKTLITGLVVVLGSMYTAFKLLTIINTIRNAVAAFRIAVIGMQTASMLCGTTLSGLRAALMLLNLSFLASPIFWIIAGIIALVAVFVLLWNKCEWFRNFWIGLWEGIKSVLETAWNFIKGVFDAVIGFVKNNWQALLLMLVNPFAGAFKLIYDNCEPFRNFIDNLVQTIVTWFNNFKTGIGNAVNGVVNFIKSIPGKIASVPGKIFNFFKSLPGKMLNIGLDVVKGIGKGITSGVSWIKNKIKEFVGNVTKFIKKVFKIGSPSKLMANEIGQWIPKGIGVGITANTDAVNKSMSNMQKEMMSTFQVSPQLANSAALHYSPTVVNNVQVNMTQDPLGQMVRDVKTFSGGSKNDYNYGMGV